MVFGREKEKKEPEIVKEDIEQLLIFSATRFQQDFYELLSDWNVYDSETPHVLKNCIGTVLFGPPKVEENEELTTNENTLFKYKPAQMKKIDSLYDKIAEHGIQKNKKILCGLIYNVLFDDKGIKAVIKIIKKEENFNGDCLMNFVSPVPVFRVLKTTVIEKNEKKEENEGKEEGEKKEKSEIKEEGGKKEESEIKEEEEEIERSENDNEEIKNEIYYIDDNVRVYKSWEGYLENNILPPCKMVVPFNGEYQGDKCEQWSEEMSYVKVEIHRSPAYRNKVLPILDTSSTLLSVAGMTVCAASLFTPIGVVAAAAGGIGLGVSSLWSIGRSSHTLIDRSKHEQSINITNREGFTCWFTIASSTLAFASAGGSILLTRAISNGATVGKMFQVLHDGVQFGTLLATGMTAGISIYNIYDTYQETQTVSKQEVFNLIASLLVLGNSVVNFQMTKTLIENHQKSIIDNFESSLRSNRHRKEFKKMVNNTKSIVEDSTKVKEQIIRGINKIENKDDFFASILRNKKSFASEGIRPAFVDGKIIINGKTLMNPAEFIKSLTNTSSKAPIISPAIPSTSITIPNKSSFENAFTDFIARHAKEFAALVIPKITDFFYVLTDISKYDNADVIFGKLLILALKIAKSIITEEYPASNIFVKAVDFLWDFIKASIREELRGLVGEPGREILMKVLISLYSSVEQKLDEWVASFREYLRIKIRQLEDGLRELSSSGFERMNIASRSLLSNGTIS
ncbi:uncharacterized protein LOC122507508 [Leptopilina heterotoma]|uniref:uncharacterized protein LOC122507508 n=1 Tax=Leptopilina heterotoma TaxID=63436 RepID=UPI001CA7C45A|nr:uncharacterized protein LOC122507508 [Leptopilina heterotoma]XP_043476201.1 uncharacterized protein LOC122507508 [Leptopilina heterotoma]XP_043476210.1 uncharacterized protein LOC122507508 [Leptopilina heterotoma]